MDFIPAKFFTPTGVGRRIRRVVVHTTENELQPGMARSVARYFAGQKTRANGSSAHYVVDAGDAVQCVAERDVAWAAPGANNDGVHIEHVGLARWNEHDWSRPAAVAMLNRSAKICADVCRRYQIPAQWLTVAELKAGKPGITDHVTCSKAFGGDHWDPGYAFPALQYTHTVGDLLIPRVDAEATAPRRTYPPVDYGDVPMKSRDIEIELDDRGNGYGQIGELEAHKVVATVPLGSFPPKDNYWPIPRIGRQQRDNSTIITAVGGMANQVLPVTVWYVD